MTLKELKQIVDRVIERQSGNEYLQVCIPNNKNSMGGVSVTNVLSANQGVDWDKGKFFIRPEKDMVEMTSQNISKKDT